MEILDII